MEIITSVKNPLIIKTKEIKLNPSGKLFLENPKLIKEAFLSNLTFDYVLIDEKKFENLLKEYSFLKNTKNILVSNSVLSSLSDTKTPQGVIAVVEFQFSKLNLPKQNFLVLENIQDPGNLGTIIRSARGTSFLDIYLIDCVSPFNQKVIRSAMGNLFCVNLYSFKTTQEFLTFANKNNLNFFVADMNGQNLFKFSEKNIGVVIGNEGNGVSSEIKKFSKGSLTIPMKNGLESLNAGVSASIIMYYLDNLN